MAALRACDGLLSRRHLAHGRGGGESPTAARPSGTEAGRRGLPFIRLGEGDKLRAAALKTLMRRPGQFRQGAAFRANLEPGRRLEQHTGPLRTHPHIPVQSARAPPAPNAAGSKSTRSVAPPLRGLVCTCEEISIHGVPSVSLYR